ncbi:MAG: hypothetical protein CSA09_04065 [Candidatus Contendobacter odensis]|uniref:Uncharacterized protein n=1 Tax=Candidatus Contendibacter odensensis TaxID=1400860 RepID=A0A2G6PEM5_9GAMM|nr:MAG: hypothetical protein CSA09_04065 [Candidatus Contendobacter odensis]
MPLMTGCAFFNIEFHWPDDSESQYICQPLATYCELIRHVFELECQVRRDNKFKSMVNAVPGFLRLQPAFRTLPAAQTEVVGGKSAAI